MYSTPHARANFIGKDLPSLHYEDPALTTVPAFWIDAAPEIYQPASRWRHPLYAATDFPELSRLFGTGTTGSKSTSGIPGSRERDELSTRYPHAWSDPVSSLRRVGISGWLTPLSSVSIWQTTKMELFRSMDSSPTGHLVRIDATISHSCMTGMRLDEKVMKLSMLMQNNQIPGFLEEPLIRCFPSPYWHPIPYSGKGRLLLKSDKGLLKSVSAYILYDKALVVLFTPYEIFSRSMLTYQFWSLDGNMVVSNYHYCPDYKLNIFLDILPRQWSHSTFTIPTDSSDASSSTEEDTTSETSSSSDEEEIFLPASISTDVPELILLNLFDF